MKTIPLILLGLLWAALTFWLVNQVRRQYLGLQSQRLDPANRSYYSLEGDTLLPGGVVVFGDSRGFAWPSPAGHTLINRSISGQTTAECLLRLEA
ncbi:MAG: SGNH/GDSL hydrolase family protein, partial [Bacteroidia bacterium]|nr:SGNH/GDSL hydrolase family protein [Bacteroidia bacterium]